MGPLLTPLDPVHAMGVMVAPVRSFQSVAKDPRGTRCCDSCLKMTQRLNIPLLRMAHNLGKRCIAYQQEGKRHSASAAPIRRYE
jgi:hypothetical protein